MRNAIFLLPCLALSFGAGAQETCADVHFDRGQSSATIRGMAPAEDPVCYTFAAGAGQTANLKVTGRNVIVSVVDVGDARTSWTFKTKAQTYKFIVAQLMRAAGPEPFTLTLAVR